MALKKKGKKMKEKKFPPIAGLAATENLGILIIGRVVPFDGANRIMIPTLK